MKNKPHTAGFLVLGAALSGALGVWLWPHGSASALVPETHYVAVDATHCDLVADGPITRADATVTGGSGATAYTLRCPVELTHSAGVPATITGITGHAFWNMPQSVFPAPQFQVTLTRRVLSTQTRTVIVSCSMGPPGIGYNLPASCTGGTSTAVDDSNAAYAVEFRATAWATRWAASGAVISYQY